MTGKADRQALADAVTLARAELRAVVDKLPAPYRVRVAFAVDVLTHGLRAHAARRTPPPENSPRRAAVAVSR